MGAGVLRKIVGDAPRSESAIVSTLIEAQKADVHTENNELRCDVVDFAVITTMTKLLMNKTYFHHPRRLHHH